MLDCCLGQHLMNGFGDLGKDVEIIPVIILVGHWPHGKDALYSDFMLFAAHGNAPFLASYVFSVFPAEAIHDFLVYHLLMSEGLALPFTDKTKIVSSIDLIKGMLYNRDMDMFVALADPTRRTILELLASSGELSATALYEQFPLTPQAVSQHLKVLRETHLVEMEKRAQKHLYRLNPHTLSQFEEWVKQMQQRWSERFDALDTVLEREKQKLVKDEQESR